MESFRVVTTLTLEDWRALQAEHAHRVRARQSAGRTLLAVAAWGVGTILLLAAANALEFDLSVPNILFGVTICGAIVWLTHWTLNRNLQRAAAESIVGECAYEFDSRGIHAVRRGVESRHDWSSIREVSVHADHLFIWNTVYSAFIVPIRDLPADVSMQTANDFLRAKLPISSVAESRTASPRATMTWWRAIPLWLVLRPTGPVEVTDRAIVSLSLASLFFWSAIDRFRVGENAVFNSYNIPTLALCALAILLIARIIAKRTARIDFRIALFTVLAVLPLVIAVDSVISSFLSGVLGMLALTLLLAYIAIYLALSLRTQTGAPQSQSALLGVAVIVLLTALSNEFYWTPSLWYLPEVSEQGGDQPTWSSGETLLFEQQARIDQALGKIAAHDAQAPSNFFVGFAGVAEQKVFAQEIGLASRVIADRFDTGSRSLLLLNDRRDVDAHPLATVSGLAYALQGVASKMDVERDILFLALSSHGSGDPQLQVSNGVLPLLQVTGENLAAALDESGIKYRVLIISACHAGAFIEPLKNENTIILTAAAKDRMSFGCSDDRDLTYFGEAFYRDALPKAASLREAFQTAKAAIGARERSEDFTPSDPQAFFGKGIEAKLRQ